VAGRKRNFTAASPGAYRGKLYRTLRGVYIDPEIAKQQAELHGRNWDAGFMEYKNVRDVTRVVLVENGIPPYLYAPYMAAAQRYYKDTKEQGRNKDGVRDYLMNTAFPDLDGNVLTQIFDRIDGIEVVEVQKPARRGQPATG